MTVLKLNVRSFEIKRGSHNIVVDLDGTLCDCAHREHWARAGEWDEFHSRLMDDMANTDVVELIRGMTRHDLYHVIAVTGRNEKYRTATELWLYNQGLDISNVLMRPDDNYEPDHILKPRMLADYFEGMERAVAAVLFILEDRDKVVEAWRNHGFRCWQVQPGGY